METAENHKSNEVLSNTNPSPSPKKKFKSFTTQFDDDLDGAELSKTSTAGMGSRREMEIYLQMNLSNHPALDDENDNPLLFWKEQKQILPHMTKLARRVFSIPASSTAVERTFSSAGNVISQRRTNLSPSTVNDIILVRSAADRWKKS
ncbi:unnamed protein product [Didymodactylos carnosus]|uniref:HAT C-terminal dimerisation domain-containing protein n=1 Tax=Didymodactylos carnosus TaxID=1234261 RepID=A0A815FLR3_9BILA|nr:unnamed protein product [Didymodactylos carnosus]CAF1330615.1 unnamed protein product [Didymodactylos carnosus]CAF3975944.1 unnamed protein product [Didymodactylos carnosus]CAF4184002.1 unnamed protein product [Didymodactylos carnosus]